MKLTTSELIYINEAAKALKQKEFILIGYIMIGLDNISSLVTYTKLDNNFINNYGDGVIINQRQLSAFIKTLSIESGFEFDWNNNIIKTISGGELIVSYNLSVLNQAQHMLNRANIIDNTNKLVLHEEEIPDVLLRLQAMKSADGAIGINHHGYYMTLFPALVPSNKGDKLYVSIYQPEMFNMFIAKLHIKKKKFDIITYINYLKV